MKGANICLCLRDLSCGMEGYATSDQTMKVCLTLCIYILLLSEAYYLPNLLIDSDSIGCWSRAHRDSAAF